MSVKNWSERLRKRTIEVLKQIICIEHRVMEYSDGRVLLKGEGLFHR